MSAAGTAAAEAFVSLEKMRVIDLVLLEIFIMAALHWFPWRLVLGGRELPKPAAYIAGTLGMMLPFTGWLEASGFAEAALVMWGAIFVAGGTVLACYGVDYVVHLAWSAREADQLQRVWEEVTEDAKGEGA